MIDDLSTGSRERVPDGVPFFEGSVADRALVDRILREQQIGAIMHFAGSIVVPELVEKPLDYYRNNTVATHALISAAVAAGVQHILFSSTAAVYGAAERVPIGGGGREAADQSLWRVEADDRADAGGRGRGLCLQLWRASLFQRRRGRPGRALGPGRPGIDPFDQGRGRSRGRQARRSSRSTEPTIRPPTGAASAIISMSATSPPRTSPRSNG